jgi:NAD(P)-dependent dehydrogenase (short-subunit alcohol dehydrogenase family)
MTEPRSVMTVLITGASTGIGEACALRLDDAGYRVFAGVRRAADGEALQARASPRLAPLLLDVTDADAIARAAETVAAATGGRLDALVNNAGVAVAGPLEHVPIAAFRRQLEVNVVGTLAVTQAMLPLLRRAAATSACAATSARGAATSARGAATPACGAATPACGAATSARGAATSACDARGRVVIIGSSNGRLATPFSGPYCASKFALEALADALRMELRPWGLAVAMVEPGAIQTPIWAKVQGDAGHAEAALPVAAQARYGPALAAVRRITERVVRMAGTTDKVADAVVHALTARRPRTRYVVGADARANVAMARWLPDRMRDALLGWVMGLPRRAPDETLEEPT